jgi:hypothetical protein
MAFTRVFYSVKQRERQCMGFRLQSIEKPNNNSEEGYKIQIVICSFFKKTDFKAGREEALTHKVTQQERHRGKTQKKQF